VFCANQKPLIKQGVAKAMHRLLTKTDSAANFYRKHGFCGRSDHFHDQKHPQIRWNSVSFGHISLPDATVSVLF
jgi:hypothetical protein